MAEYIDKEAFLKGIKERYCLPCKGAGKDHDGCKCRACWVDDICGDVIDAPAADVAPVKHGRWVRKGANWYCTECNRGYRIICGAPAAVTFEFCPNCGCKMDGVNDGG